MSQKLFITTSIDYVSGNPHIGHAYEKIGADVLARWNRNLKRDVFFLTGTDEHGAKIAQKAEKENLKVEEFVEKNTAKFKEMCKKLNISHNYFIRTTQEEHKKVVKYVLQKSYEKGDIYFGEYEGLYCVDCEHYYTEENLSGNFCPTHKRKCESVKEENYFFKLSCYEKRLLKFFEENPSFISPKHRRKEIINRVKEGLCDISISRPKSKLTWGVELPFDKSHVSYVWFDALFNYYSATQFNEGKQKFWPCDTHIIGKDISWFHCVYWVAFLMSCDLPLPKKVHMHGHILDRGGTKMSKSLGNVVDPFEEVEKLGCDEIRYILMSLGSFSEDLKYDKKVAIEKINTELNNDLGNLVSRVFTLTEKFSNSTIPTNKNLEGEDKEFVGKLNFFEEYNSRIQNFEYNKALDILFTKIRLCNTYINSVEPWKIKDGERLKTILNVLCSFVVFIAEYIDNFMPKKAENIFKQFNVKQKKKFSFSLFEKPQKLGEKTYLFKKITEEEKPPNFSNLNLKVGKIIGVKDHENSENLYIEKVDVGEGKVVQVVSGLKKYYTKEQLLDRKVILVTNLKPAKFRGIISYGMILLAEDKNKNLGFLETTAPIGTQLKCGGEVAENSNIILIDEFFKISMKSLGDRVVYSGCEVKADGCVVSVENSVKGIVR